MRFNLLYILPLVVLFFVSTIEAKEPGLLVDEAFDGGSLPENWRPGGRKDSFSIVDGTLRGVAAPDDSHGPAISYPISGHNLTVEFDLKFANPKGYFLFLIDGDSQFSGQAHLLRFAVTGKQIHVSQDRGDPASKLAQKKERDARGGKRLPATKAQLADPSFYRIEQLGKQPATPTDGKWHHVRIELQGTKVTAQLDEKEPISATATVLDVAKSKIVFLVGQSGDMRIDNVKVTAIGK